MSPERSDVSTMEVPATTTGLIAAAASGDQPSPPWAMPEALRRNNIDAIRFALATLVILAHSYALPEGSDRTEPLYRFSSGQRTMGGMAVDFFFILSGFLITHSWLRDPRPLPFLRKRALRIYPAFIAAIIVGNLLAVIFSSGVHASWRSMNLGQLLWNTATLRGYSIGNAFAENPFKGVVNGSLWSIQYEFWCYVGIMLLGMTPFLARHRAVTLLIFLASLAGSIAYSLLDLRMGGGLLGKVVGSPTLWARLLPCYLAGAVFYRYRDRIPWHPGLLAASVVALVVACKVPHAMAVVSPISGAYLLFVLAFAAWVPAHGFGRFGDFSYGIYVYAFPVQQALLGTTGTDVNTWAFFSLSFVATMMLAVPSWYLVERPALRLKQPRLRAGTIRVDRAGTPPLPAVSPAAQGPGRPSR